MEMQFACKAQTAQNDLTTDLKAGDVVRRKQGSKATGTIERIYKADASFERGYTLIRKTVLKAQVRWNGRNGRTHRGYINVQSLVKA